MVNIIIVNLCIKHSLDSSFETKFGIIDLATRLDKFGLSSISHNPFES